MEGGSPYNTLLGCSQAHHRRVTSPSKADLRKSRGAEGQMAGRKPNQGLQGRDTLPGCLLGCPRTALAPLTRHETYQDESLGATVWITFWTKWELLPRGVGHITGVRQEKTVLKLHNLN